MISVQTQASSGVGITATAVATADGGSSATLAVIDSNTGAQIPSSATEDIAGTPSTTAGPSQSTDAAPSDLGGSRLTVVTATLGSGDDAMVATLTSVVPGPVVTEAVVEEQLGNGGAVGGVPMAAAVCGLAVALL